MSDDELDGWRWTVGGWFSRIGWWILDIGAAIAWREKHLLPWNKS